MNKVVIIMGSKRDLDYSKKIVTYLKALSLTYVFRVASAHKTPKKVFEILEQYKKEKVVYITIAGRSNALSAFVDAHTTKPVIACPPYSERFCGADIYSSLRVPSGIGAVVTIELEGAAIAAAKIFALENQEAENRVKKYQLAKKSEVQKSDESLQRLQV